MQQNPYDQFDNAGPVYGAPAKPDVPSGYQSVAGGLAPIPGGPADKPDTTWRIMTPEEAAAQRLNPNANYKISSSGEVAKIGDSEPEINKGELRFKIKRVLDELQAIKADAGDGGGWFETGGTGASLRWVPGTASYSLGGKIKGVQGPIATDALSSLQAAGTRLGPPLSDKDIQLAGSTIANLDPNLDHPEFLHQVERAEEVYRRIFDGLGGEEQQQGFTEEQKKLIGDFLPQAKSAEQLRNFARQVTRGKHSIGNAEDILNYLNSDDSPEGRARRLEALRNVTWEMGETRPRPADQQQSAGVIDFNDLPE